MDYSQVEEQFRQLKEQFSAGMLDETAFKARLNELMVQDGEGRWWMIGYETGQWYVHDGSAWVRSDPPGRSPAKPLEPPEPVSATTEPQPAVQAEPQVEEAPHVEPAAQAPSHVEEPPAGVPAKLPPEFVEQPSPEEPVAPAQAEVLPAAGPAGQAAVQIVETTAAPMPVKEPAARPVEKPSGYIPNRGREALFVVIGAAAFALEGFFQSGHVFMLFGLIPSLSGILFGPWVGGLTGALGELLAFGVFSSQGNGSYDPIPFLIMSSLSGVIAGLVVKDAKNWKSILFACLLARIPLFLGDFIGQADNIGESYFADWFINRLVDFLLPSLLLVPLAARALVDMVKDRGWYWAESLAARKIMRPDWNTILLLGVAWSAVWGLIYGLGLKVDGLSNSRLVYAVMTGVASGLAGAFVLRKAFLALKTGQILLITAGWGIGFVAAYEAFANVAVFGNASFDYVVTFLILGFAGGIGMGVALKWAGVYTDWRQALLSTLPWGVGLTVLVYLSILLNQIFYRLFIAGLLVGAVGAWGIFWQKQAPQTEVDNNPS
jgi:hypothetical protein